MNLCRLAVFVILGSVAKAAIAQDADLTILVEGQLLEHGGVVEVTALPAPGASVSPRTITLTDRYARIELRHRPGESYNYRFRPVPDAMSREGMESFLTETLSFGTLWIDGPHGEQEADWRSVRVFPFEEYGAPEMVDRTGAAWGETQAYADPPPANHWGARALPWAFDTSGDRRTVRLVCENDNAVSVCTPDPDDALLMEALWWRSIAEGRLERLRHEALDDCYESGGLFRRPQRCEGEPGRGWPSYRPVN